MGLEENKALVERFYDQVWNAGNVDVAAEVFAEDYIRHDLRPSEALPGPAGQAKIAADFRAAFPDLHMDLDLILAEGDLVAARWTTQGTNTGPWAGRPATGKRARFSGVNIFRLESGKVVELWNHRDDLGLMQQIGAEIYAGASPVDHEQQDLRADESRRVLIEMGIEPRGETVGPGLYGLFGSVRRAFTRSSRWSRAGSPIAGTLDA